jgi:hypothetical protein
VVTAEAGLLAVEGRAVGAEAQVTLARLAVLAAAGMLDPATAVP